MAATLAILLKKVVDPDWWDAEDLVVRLAIVIFAAFLDAGFLPYGAKPISGPLLKRVRGTGWSLSRHFTARQLVYRKDAEAAVLKLSAQGSDVVFHAYLTKGGANRWSAYRERLDAAALAALAPLLSRGLDDTALALRTVPAGVWLWKALADGLCRDLLLDLCRRNGMPVEPSFMSLPADVKVAILQRLTDKEDLARVKRTSKEMRCLVNGELRKAMYERYWNSYDDDDNDDDNENEDDDNYDDDDNEDEDDDNYDDDNDDDDDDNNDDDNDDPYPLIISPTERNWNMDDEDNDNNDDDDNNNMYQMIISRTERNWNIDDDDDDNNDDDDDEDDDPYPFIISPTERNWNIDDDDDNNDDDDNDDLYQMIISRTERNWNIDDDDDDNDDDDPYPLIISPTERNWNIDDDDDDDDPHLLSHLSHWDILEYHKQRRRQPVPWNIDDDDDDNNDDDDDNDDPYPLIISPTERNWNIDDDDDDNDDDDDPHLLSHLSHWDILEYHKQQRRQPVPLPISPTRRYWNIIDDDDPFLISPTEGYWIVDDADTDTRLYSGLLSGRRESPWIDALEEAMIQQTDSFPGAWLCDDPLERETVVA